MGRSNSGERERYWRQLIARQELSGRSIATFCQNEGVSPGSFYNWRRRLAEREQEGRQAAGFVAVPISTSPADPCEVVLANGRRVVVPVRFDARSLGAIIAVLEGEAAC